MAFGKKNIIEAILTLNANNFRKGIDTSTAKVQRFGRDFKKSLSTFGGQELDFIANGFLAVGAAATAAAAGGVYAFTRFMGESITKAREFSVAVFSMESSLGAANREFTVGTAEQWEQQIKELGNTLRVYSETDLRNAASRTVDMTKRLGLSAEQMKKVIQISGDLGAGKTSIVDAVERVTAALRGEAEASEYLGLTLNEDYVKGWYKARGATQGAWKDLTDLEKAQIRYNILLEQATPSLGKAAKSVKIYDGAVALLANDYGDLQKAAGGLVTNNTFVIESYRILAETFQGFTASITANRQELVGLVKNGFLLLVDGIGGAIETVRFFYNGWQGLSIVAHGAVVVIIKGMEMVAVSIRGILKPLDLALTGLAKIGAIDSNPLKDWQETIGGFGDFSVEEFNKLLEKVTTTNQTFDAAKKVVEEYKQKIAEIPAEYKSTVDQMKGNGGVAGEIVKEVKLIDGVYTNVYDEAEKKSEKAKGEQVEDAQAVGKEVKLIGGVFTNVYDEAKQDSADFRKAALADIAAVKKASSGIKLVDGTYTNRTEGYARGGDPFFGGLRGYGGGDRRLIMVEDGEHVVRKEAVRAVGHGFFQKYNNLNFLRSLPRYATGGPIGSAATATPMAAGASYNITLNYSGQASQSSAREMAKMVMTELQKMHRGRS